MTAPLDLDALLALAEAATPGPWRVTRMTLFGGSPGAQVDAPGYCVADCCESDLPGADAAFIAAARTAVPELIEQVRDTEAVSKICRRAVVEVATDRDQWKARAEKAEATLARWAGEEEAWAVNAATLVARAEAAEARVKELEAERANVMVRVADRAYGAAAECAAIVTWLGSHLAVGQGSEFAWEIERGHHHRAARDAKEPR
jgi:hypothetical protein